ncbi:MAG: flotillin family protein [Clostridiales bacterium]|nr:flotillin family protein [Clostridiales bacterium]
MPESLVPFVTIIGIIAAIIVLILIMWKKAPQDKAIIVTGLKKRVIQGRGGLVIPFLEQTDRISLENIKVEVRTSDSLDRNGVPISADGVAIIKVNSDYESVLSAVEQFNTGNEKGTIVNIKETSQDVLEGKLREIISKMSVEEIYRDREKFANEVEEVAKADFNKMGIEFKTFTIRDIDDKEGYLIALGAKQIAVVKKDAAIAEAEAEREKKQKTAEAFRLGKEAELLAETQVASAEKEKVLKLQEYRLSEDKAKARADLAYDIEKNIIRKDVIEAEKRAELFEEQQQTVIAEQQAIKTEKELEATVRKQAEAEKFRAEKESEASKFQKVQQAEAEAESIKIKGNAEAEAIRQKGIASADAMKAEAEAMKEKAEAYRMYGEAAVLEMIISRLPEIAHNISEPLSKLDKMVVIDNGGQGGASKVTRNVTNILSELPEVVDALTGIDLKEVLGKFMNKDTENIEDTEKIDPKVIMENTAN